jgi:N-acetylmuramoyl-L-alanine amidase
VVIDPGHGGVDPGAISLTGAYEKNIVLALAREVRAQLEKGNKVKCVLTRDRDIFIPLRDRVAFARSANADLFLSLHADTVADENIRGLSVYTLSQTASDSEAQALADKENKADIVAGLDLSKESPEVTNILIDLVQRESMNLSAVFAHDVIQEVQRETRQLLQNTHRFAGFAVLKAPDVPSVLVETGYLSNEKDEQMLRRPEYRAKLANALARAIERYFAQLQKSGRR